MTKGAALQAFFSRFMDAYASNAVSNVWIWGTRQKDATITALILTQRITLQ